MKKVLLVCLMVLLVQGVCWAKIEKGEDKFEGTSWYNVDYDYTDYNNSAYIISSFNFFFSPESPNGSKNFQISVDQDDVYALDKTIKMQIDDTIYTWKTTSNSSRSNGYVDIVFSLPDDVYNSLMKTQKNIAIRFFYNALTGEYKRDYIIPFKTIKEVQNMYTTYGEKSTSNNVSQKQLAK